MCHRHGLPVIPPVVPRPRLPVAVGSMEGKTERTTLRGKQVHLEPEAESVDDTGCLLMLCVYICMYIYIYACIYVYMYICSILRNFNNYLDSQRH